MNSFPAVCPTARLRHESVTVKFNQNLTGSGPLARGPDCLTPAPHGRSLENAENTEKTGGRGLILLNPDVILLCAFCVLYVRLVFGFLAQGPGY